jgi:hypothetical protein
MKNAETGLKDHADIRAARGQMLFGSADGRWRRR